MGLFWDLRDRHEPEEADLCEQCGGQPASATVERAWRRCRLCEDCLASEDATPTGPIAAAWTLDGGDVAIERVWPVTVNLHRYHVERVLETGVEVPPRWRADPDAEP